MERRAWKGGGLRRSSLEAPVTNARPTPHAGIDIEPFACHKADRLVDIQYGRYSRGQTKSTKFFNILEYDRQRLDGLWSCSLKHPFVQLPI